MKTVSFVIPVYNPPEKRFRALLESVLSQKGVGLEVVAVNDGSTNNALAILREYEAANPGVLKVVDQKNAGEGPSRNEGFRHATGDYVWFVDADDLVRPGAAAYLVDAIDGTDADQILFDSVTCTPLNDKTFPGEWTGKVRKTTALAEVARHRIGPPFRLSRKSFLDRIGVRYCDAKTGADGPESLRWLFEAHSLLKVDDPCYKYIMAPGSSSQAPADVRFFTKGWQIMDAYDSLRERFPDYAPWIDLWNYTRARGHISLANKYLAEKGKHSPEEFEAVRRARDEYQRRFDALDAANPLVALYDFARAVGHRDLRSRLLVAERDAKLLRKIKKSALAWKEAATAVFRRLAAPFRSIPRLFAGRR